MPPVGSYVKATFKTAAVTFDQRRFQLKGDPNIEIVGKLRSFDGDEFVIDSAIAGANVPVFYEATNDDLIEITELSA